MRGRLIFPFTAVLARAAETGAMDDEFREPAALSREELPEVHVPCQVEPKAADETHMVPGGDSPRTEITLIFHFRDLERQGLVDEATGKALIRPGDRLVRILDGAGNEAENFPSPPGAYAREVCPRGFGIGRRCNLLLATFVSRELWT